MKTRKKIITHLKEDINGYAKQRKSLKNEMKEDKDLIETIKGKKHGTKKKSITVKKKTVGTKKADGKSSPRKKRGSVKSGSSTQKARGIKRGRVSKRK